MQDIATRPSDVPGPPKREGQDEIDASKAPLMDHLIELRQRLIYSILAFFVAFLLCFMVAKHIYNFLTLPLHWVWPEARLQATHLLEYFFTNLKVAMFGAGVISFPVVASQIYKFIAPGLYKNEKDAFRPYLVATPILFLLGGAIVYFIAMPLLIKFSISLLPTNEAGMTPIDLLPKVNEYLSLIMTLIFGFGIIFQLPVVLTLMARAGIITGENLVEFRRYAIVGIFGASAVLTPPDAVSMIIMALPTCLLYEASIWVVKRVEAQQAARRAAEDAE